MKIRSLHLKNIGVFEDETISFPEKQDKDLCEIHILTGENGTGKTTILQALASGMLQIPNLRDYFVYKKIIHYHLFENIITKKLHKNDDSSFFEVFWNPECSTKISQSSHTTKSISSKGLNSQFLNIPLEKLDKAYKSFFEDIGINICAFAYSGYRFIEHQENINIKEKEGYNPLTNALEFNKKNDKNDYSLNEWLANRMAQRNSAFFDGIKEDVEKYSRSIENLKYIIELIIEIPIDFKFKNEKLKVVAVKEGAELDFDLLPDGLRSIISWLGDLIMRMDAIKWENDLPVFEREFILFLDEIEVHLHPSWQRKILPVVQKLFKNAQIFITTHSPFIVNSVDGAYIYELKLDEQGNCHAEQPPHISSTSMPIDEVLEEIYNLTPTQMYGEKMRKEIEEFQTLLQSAYKKEDAFSKKELLEKAKNLAHKSIDLRNNVQFELKQLSKNLGEEFAI